MADHIRKQIRDAVGTALTGLTTTGTNVFTSRVYPVEKTKLPCLVISTSSEAIDLEAGSLDAPERQLSLEVKGYAKVVETVDDTLDTICKEVETAMRSDISLGGLSTGLDLSSTDFELTSDGDQPHGIATLLYIIVYRTPFGDPSTVVV